MGLGNVNAEELKWSNSKITLHTPSHHSNRYCENFEVEFLRSVGWKRT
jgi:hypothetical protein